MLSSLVWPHIIQSVIVEFGTGKMTGDLATVDSLSLQQICLASTCRQRVSILATYSYVVELRRLTFVLADDRSK